MEIENRILILFAHPAIHKSRVNQRLAEELDEILQTEVEQSIHESDEAWDITTLREEIIQIYSEMDENQTERQEFRSVSLVKKKTR